MDLIRSKNVLNKRMREVFYQDEECPFTLPYTLFFCEGLGEPTFKITIEKFSEDSFVDGQGNQWVKVKK